MAGLLGIINLNKINPYGSDGDIDIHLTNGGNGDYKLSIVQDEVIGYAGEDEMEIGQTILGKIRLTAIQDWTEGNWIGVEFQISRNNIVQVELAGKREVKIGEVHRTIGNEHTKREYKSNLPFSKF